MTRYDPTRRHGTNDLSRSDYQSVESLLGEMYQDRAKSLKRRARRAARVYAIRYHRAQEVKPHLAYIREIERAHRSYLRLMALVAELA